jgi:hypothetical protein
MATVGRKGRFDLLLVRADGTRLLRLSLARRILHGALLALALAVSTLGAISGDYVSMKRQFGEVAALQRQAAEQQALIDAYQARIAQMRNEITARRGLHANIWEPFGPEAGPAPKGTGIGGGESMGAALVGDRPTLSQELDLLAATVNEEGQSLRALQRMTAKAGRALAALPLKSRPRRGD